MKCADCDNVSVGKNIQLCEDCLSKAMNSDIPNWDRGRCNNCGEGFFYVEDKPEFCSKCDNIKSTGEANNGRGI